MTFTRLGRSAMLLGLLAANGVARAAGAQSFVNTLDNSLRERAAQTRFRGHVPAAQLGAVTLAHAFATVADGTGLRIHIDWPALQAINLSPETIVHPGTKIMSYNDYLNAVCTGLGVRLVLCFRTPANQFCLTTAAASPVPMPAENAGGGEAETTAILGGKENAATALKLEEAVTTFAFDQVSIERAIDALRKSAKVNIDVNWTALQASGIDRVTPVSIKLSAVPAKKALDMILSHVGGGAASLGYTISGGVIEISTKDDLNSAKYQVVHVFDIRPFLTALQPGTQPYENTVRNLADLIKTTVAPDSWRDAGGSIGSLRELNGSLIVNQTQDNQIAIYNLLRQMRARISPQN